MINRISKYYKILLFFYASPFVLCKCRKCNRNNERPTCPEKTLLLTDNYLHIPMLLNLLTAQSSRLHLRRQPEYQEANDTTSPIEITTKTVMEKKEPGRQVVSQLVN